MEENSNTLKLGSVLVNKYRINKVLGEGGFGVVYYARDLDLDRAVAIKECLPCDFAQRGRDSDTVFVKTKSNIDDFEWAKNRFIDEARILAKFSNKNLLSANNVFSANGTVYMDSDFIEGVNLEDYVKDGGACSEEDVLNILKGISSALKEVHSVGLLHRDIKPANIIIRASDNEPVLIDFGSARMAVSSKTKPLTAMVTQGYAPLEQYYEDGNQGAWTDIYALAGVCYKMITGDKPPEAVARVRKDNIIKLADNYKDKYSKNLLKALDKSLLLEEEKRPQNIDDLLSSLVKEDAGIALPKIKNLSIDENLTTSDDLSVAKGKSKKFYIGIAFLVSFITAIAFYLNTENYSNYEYYDYDDSYYYDEPEPTTPEPTYTPEPTTPVSTYTPEPTYKPEPIQQVSMSSEELFKAGKNAYNKKDYAKAVEYYKKAADLGYDRAMYSLGDCYYFGEGLTRDYTKAFEYFKKAADLSNASGQYSVGYCYYYGISLNKDYTKAYEYFKKAAEQDHTEGQYNLGNCYYNGRGVGQDYAKAFEYYKKAADKDNNKAQNSLGNCYYKGEGVTKDYAKAFEYYKKAADKGNVEAQNSVGNCYYKGEGVALDYSKAFEYYKKAADKANAYAQSKLGDCYYYGRGVVKDYLKAFEYYKKSADQANSEGQYNVGYSYYYGEGVGIDYAKAFEYYNKAALEGHSKAQYRLGLCYFDGRGVGQDYAKAVEYYKKSADQNYKKGYDGLGDCYNSGYGVEKSKIKAFECYKKAADLGDSNSQCKVGLMYYYGKDGITKNMGLGLGYLKKSADQNNEYAKDVLNKLGY